jgi:excisionase family DNA binding protein
METAFQVSSDPLYTKEQAAGILGISITSLNRLIKDKTIPTVRVGSRVRLQKGKLDEYINNQNQ